MSAFQQRYFPPFHNVTKSERLARTSASYRFPYKSMRFTSWVMPPPSYRVSYLSVQREHHATSRRRRSAYLMVATGVAWFAFFGLCAAIHSAVVALGG